LLRIGPVDEWHRNSNVCFAFTAQHLAD